MNQKKYKQIDDPLKIKPIAHGIVIISLIVLFMLICVHVLMGLGVIMPSFFYGYGIVYAYSIPFIGFCIFSVLRYVHIHTKRVCPICHQTMTQFFPKEDDFVHAYQFICTTCGVSIDIKEKRVDINKVTF